MVRTAVRPGMPHADSKIAKYLTKQIDALSGVKSQREIAVEMGYEKPNIISMFKRGETKIPLDKIPALARAINVDPSYLFRMAMEQYWPDNYKAIASEFGAVITANEREFVEEIRKITGNSDPKFTPKIAAALKEVINS